MHALSQSCERSTTSLSSAYTSLHPSLSLFRSLPPSLHRLRQNAPRFEAGRGRGLGHGWERTNRILRETLRVILLAPLALGGLTPQRVMATTLRCNAVRWLYAAYPDSRRIPAHTHTHTHNHMSPSLLAVMISLPSLPCLPASDGLVASNSHGYGALFHAQCVLCGIFLLSRLIPFVDFF